MKQARGEARQSGGATSAASPNLQEGKEDTVGESLVIHVAKALSAELKRHCVHNGECYAHADSKPCRYDSMGAEVDGEFNLELLAEAAIKAMSEARPQSITVTEEMIEAAARTFFAVTADQIGKTDSSYGNLSETAKDKVRSCARAAIDAALSKVSPLVSE